MWWEVLISVIQEKLEVSFIIQHFVLALSIVFVGFDLNAGRNRIACGGGAFDCFDGGNVGGVNRQFHV